MRKQPAHNYSAAMSPLTKQYNEIKAKYPDALILFKVGDGYIAIQQDAIRIADCLGTILTEENDGGISTEFPFRSLDTFLPKLVKAGNKVAICEGSF